MCIGGDFEVVSSKLSENHKGSQDTIIAEVLERFST